MSTHLLHVKGQARLVRITVEKILLAFDIRLLKAGKDPGLKCVNSTTEEQIIGIWLIFTKYRIQTFRNVGGISKVSSITTKLAWPNSPAQARLSMPGCVRHWCTMPWENLTRVVMWCWALHVCFPELAEVAFFWRELSVGKHYTYSRYRPKELQ